MEIAEQKGRIQELEAQMKQQKKINLLRSTTFIRRPFETLDYVPKWVKEGMVLDPFFLYKKGQSPRVFSEAKAHFKSYLSCFENGFTARQNIGRVYLRGVDDPVELFLFLPDPYEMFKSTPDFSAPGMEAWKLWVDTPVEFVEGVPMKVYRRRVEAVEAQMSIDLPSALFYIFKYV